MSTEFPNPPLEPHDYEPIRAALARVDVPAAARDSAVAAALAEFDLLHRRAATAADVSGQDTARSVVVPLRSRRWMTALTTAAAAVLLVMVGANVLTRDDDAVDLALTKETADLQVAASPTSASSAAGSVPGVAMAAPNPAGAEAVGGTTFSITVETPAQLLALVTTAQERAAGAVLDAAVPTVTPTTSPAAADGAPPATVPCQLAEPIIAQVIYQGFPAYVVERDQQVLAIDSLTCAVLVAVDR